MNSPSVTVWTGSRELGSGPDALGPCGDEDPGRLRLTEPQAQECCETSSMLGCPTLLGRWACYSNANPVRRSCHMSNHALARLSATRLQLTRSAPIGTSADSDCNIHAYHSPCRSVGFQQNPQSYRLAVRESAPPLWWKALASLLQIREALLRRRIGFWYICNMLADWKHGGCCAARPDPCGAA